MLLKSIDLVLTSFTPVLNQCNAVALLSVYTNISELGIRPNESFACKIGWPYVISWRGRGEKHSSILNKITVTVKKQMRLIKYFVINVIMLVTF